MEDDASHDEWTRNTLKPGYPPPYIVYGNRVAIYVDYTHPPYCLNIGYGIPYLHDDVGMYVGNERNLEPSTEVS